MSMRNPTREERTPVLRKLLLLIGLVSLLAVPTWGQRAKVDLKVKVDAKQVVLGDYFTATFVVENGEASSFKPPNFANFLVLDQGSGTNMSIINGVVSRSSSYTYTLQPKKVGKFYIRPAVAKIGRKTYKTKSIQIEVVKGKQGSQSDLATRLEDGTGIFIRAELDTSKAYFGQQIPVTYRIYSNVGNFQHDVIEDPEFPGFYAERIRRFYNDVQGEVIKGVSYKTQVIRRYVLFPQKTGVLKIPPLTARVAVPLRQRWQTYRTVIQSEPQTITVNSLPENGKPDNFSGAVGNYEMVTRLGNSTVTTDDAITFQMEILGEGDIKQIQAPDLGLPKDLFEVYEPTSNEEFYEQDGLRAGKKVFEYMILPKKPGNYKFTPAFSYFHADESKYVTLKDQVYDIDVGMGSNPNASGRIKKETATAKKEIRFLKTKTSLSNSSHHFVGSALFWGLFAIPFIFLLGIARAKRNQILDNNIDEVIFKQKRANKEALKRLSKAKKLLDNKQNKEFYKEISEALWGYIGDKLDMPVSELSRDNVQEKLTTKGVNSVQIEELLGLFNTCDMALFASMENEEERQSTYQKAMEVISEMQEQL